MITIDQFKDNFPVFKDAPETYPDTMINFWWGLGVKLLNADRWGSLYDEGLQLYVAHNLVLDGLAKREADAGGVPGLTRGVISSEGADGASVSYDTAATTIPNAADANKTEYGIRFKKLSRMVGAGPVQVGQSEQPSVSASAWPGVTNGWW